MIKIGVMTSFRKDPAAMEAEFAKFEALSLNACQLNVYNNGTLTQEMAEATVAAAKRHGVEITAVWTSWSGPEEWNFTKGPQTLGIVPELYRLMRVREIKQGAEFAKMMGVTDIITHAGFLPEDPNSPQFPGIKDALLDIATTLKENGQWFLFETGQETPVAMLRFIESVGTGNLGVNLDTANLILYGKANPVDALDVFGDYVRNTHFKDGFYPTNGMELGSECPLGEGKVDVKGVIDGLKKHGYTGPYIIEREISGEQQTQDIIRARDLILSCL